jgi:predicted TIM-barrel fold metal-dependent hydrolase
MMRGLTDPARRRVERRLGFLEAHADRLVVDGDTHITALDRLAPELAGRVAANPNYFHGRPIPVEELLWEMDRADVDLALSWQNPSATPYGDDEEANFEALLAANRYIHQAARRHPVRIIPAGWTDPKALGVERACRLAGICVGEFGFGVVKMNPAQNRYPIDSDMVLEVVDTIVGLGAVPAFHYGADTPFTPAEGLARVAARHPDHPVIGVHMGGGGAAFVEADELYQRSRALGLEHPNLHFVLSAKRDTHIESDLITYRLAGPPFAHNLSFGSDAPYGRVSWNFGGARAMLASLAEGRDHPDPRLRARPGLFDDDARTDLLGRNLVHLLIATDRRLLAA